LLAIGTLSVSGAQLRSLTGHVPAAARGSVPIASLPSATRLGLSIGLPLRNEELLTNFLQQLYDPNSPEFQHYLTPEEFTERFGPTEAQYQSLISFVSSKGFIIVSQHQNRLLLDVNASVNDIEQAFSTRLKLYHHPKENRMFFAPEVEPSVSADVPILDISGFDNYSLPHPISLRRSALSGQAKPNIGSAPDGSYRGYDFRAAYLPGVVLSGSGQIVGLLEFDGYYPNDIASYAADAGLQSVPLQNVLMGSFNGTPGPNNAEVALDIEVAISVAPGLSKVLVYEGTSGNSMLNRMANDNLAKQLSSSWTYGINGTTENIFRQFASQGQSMFQASGDEGAYSGTIPTPADDPNLTVVGGTTLSTVGPNGQWSSETTWNWAVSGGGTSASSGGISTAYVIPNYQKGIDMSNNQGSTVMRNIPDVSFTADNIWVVWDNGSQGAFGGTSAATPLWAAFMALVNQQAVANGLPVLGFVNPALYAIAKGTNYSSCFHDITTGNNKNSASPNRFGAVAGYDLCTGWGTPAGQTLINALAGGSNLPAAFKNNPFVAASANVGQPCSGSISNQATVANPADRLTFTKVSGPPWLTLGTDGSLSGTPSSQNIGTNAFVVSVTESAGMSNSATMFLNVNGAPAFINSQLVQSSINAGTSFFGSIAGEATDPNPGDTLTFSKVGGPQWLLVSPQGNLSGTPAIGDVGTNLFTVRVTDSGGLWAQANLTVNVNGSPSFAANPFTAPAVSVGQVYSQSLTNQATDPNPGAVLTFSKVSGPSWLSVTADGLLIGTPTASDVGTNSFSVKVTDTGGLSSSATMNVAVMPLSSPPTIHISINNQIVSLDWSNGAPPFQVQASTNLASGIWQNLGEPTTNRSISVTPPSQSAAFRILNPGP
jgi:subtilase family serine protease